MTEHCPTDDDLSALADGALNNEEQAALLRQHCVTCEKCRQALAAVQSSSLVRELPATLIQTSGTSTVMGSILVPSLTSHIEARPEDDTKVEVAPATGGLSQVGRVLKRDYRVERELGKGGMGWVYLASHMRLPDRRFAIKVLSADAKLFDRFRLEAQITSRLQHPNIVRVSDYAQMADGTAFLVMDYLEGENLAQRLKRVKRLSLEETLKLARALGSGLQAAHAANVIHRDLKPENVMLARQQHSGVVVETPVLVDFGISKIRDASESLTTDGGKLIGTPCYMSPEQARGDNSAVDQQTDQFALGAILYECLAGQRAFPGIGVVKVLAQVQHHQPTALPRLAPRVPRHVERAIMRALSKKREDRFESISAFLDALEHPPARWRDALGLVFHLLGRRMVWLVLGTALLLWRFASLSVEAPSLGEARSADPAAMREGVGGSGGVQLAHDGAVDLFTAAPSAAPDDSAALTSSSPPDRAGGAARQRRKRPVPKEPKGPILEF